MYVALHLTMAVLYVGFFQRTDCIRQLCARVECFTGCAKITPQRWRIAIFADSVLVMTAQQLLNMLAIGVAKLQQIDLLVMLVASIQVKVCNWNAIALADTALSLMPAIDVSSHYTNVSATCCAALRCDVLRCDVLRCAVLRCAAMTPVI